MSTVSTAQSGARVGLSVGRLGRLDAPDRTCGSRAPCGACNEGESTMDVDAAVR
jgi:hypothetical protein